MDGKVRQPDLFDGITSCQVKTSQLKGVHQKPQIWSDWRQHLQWAILLDSVKH